MDPPESPFPLQWNSRKDWPSWFFQCPEKHVCLYDTYEFAHEPVFIPWLTDNFDSPHGPFCSIECAHAYLTRDFGTRNRILQRLAQMAFKYYGLTRIVPRRPWQLLERFRGEQGIPIETWRDSTPSTWHPHTPIPWKK